jgi:hypothetical protein
MSTLHGLLRVVALVSCLLSPFAFADSEYEVGEVAKVKILDVRPTQFVVGAKEIEFRMIRIADKDADGEIADYKKKNPGKAVIGPDGTLFLVDGHHLATALYNLGKESMRVEIVKDYSDLSWRAFWIKLRTKHLCYLRDARGRVQSPSKLPHSIPELKDDPYRSLAYLVSKSEGFEDHDSPFQEFYWAQFYRRRIKAWKDTPAGWERALNQAMRLSKSRAASRLPGWTGEEGDCSEILEMLQSEED